MEIFLDILRGLAAVVVAYMVVFVAALVNIVFERRALAIMQDRLGPNRTGPQGIFQSVADAFKMLGKEDFVPAGADKMLFTVAPIMVMIGAVAVQLVVPYTKGWTSQDLDIGIIYIVAVTSFTVLAILMGGWASHNKYSLVGALRSAAQMVSYEVPMVLSLLCVAMVVGSLSLNDVVAFQGGYRWGFFLMPTTFLIFWISSIAELNRGPFDLPEAESELVAGYGTEYSGMRFGMFFLNEYAGLTIMSMVVVTLFFGGWEGPGVDLLKPWGVSVLGFFWFLLKTYILVFVLVWVRLSIPRLQVDQLMGLAWKFLIPLCLVNIIVTAAIVLWAPAWKWVMAAVSWVVFLGVIALFDPILRWRLKRQRAAAPKLSERVV